MGWNRAGEIHDVSVRTYIGNAAKEFQELGRADDGVGDARVLDQSFLRDLSAIITNLRIAVVVDDRERNMVPYAGCGLRREKIVAGSLEKFERWLVF